MPWIKDNVSETGMVLYAIYIITHCCSNGQMKPAGLDHRGSLWKPPDWTHDDPLPFNPSTALISGTIIVSTLLCAAFQTASKNKPCGCEEL